MPMSKKAQRANKKKTEPSSSGVRPVGARIDILLGGPLLIVPAVIDGLITDIEVFSPQNGHPVGAVFVPGVWFKDAELNDPKCKRWPEPESFSLLDPHGYAIELTQDSPQPLPGFPVASIPDTNHKVKPGRRLSSDWEVAINVQGRLSEWSSQRLFRVTDDLYVGYDAPKSGSVAGMHRLTYSGVVAAEFHGAPAKPREYLQANVAKGGSLIILGEIPYQPTLLHERRAIDALSKLAGLDLHLATTDPQPHKSRMMIHVMDCGHSILVV